MLIPVDVVSLAYGESGSERGDIYEREKGIHVCNGPSFLIPGIILHDIAYIPCRTVSGGKALGVHVHL